MQQTGTCSPCLVSLVTQVFAVIEVLQTRNKHVGVHQVLYFLVTKTFAIAVLERHVSKMTHLPNKGS